MLGKRPILFRCEAVVLACAGVAAAMSWGYGVPLRAPLRLYLEKLSGGLMWYATGLLLCLLIVRVGDIRSWRKGDTRVSLALSWQHYASRYLRLRFLVHDLRLVHAVAVCFLVFIQLKHFVPSVNSALFDEQLAVIDRFFCGERLCGELLLQTIGADAAPLMSSSYTFFFPYMGLLLMVMVLQRDAEVARCFCAGFVVVWLAGIFLVYLVPSWGPCYFFSPAFSSLTGTEVAELRDGLWQMKVFLDRFPQSPRGAFMISGFPSLHLAVPVLGSLFLQRIHWSCALLSWLFAAVTFLTTLYFGWHYLLDDLGAVLLGYAAYYYAAMDCEKRAV